MKVFMTNAIVAVAQVTIGGITFDLRQHWGGKLCKHYCCVSGDQPAHLAELIGFEEATKRLELILPALESKFMQESGFEQQWAALFPQITAQATRNAVFADKERGVQQRMALINDTIVPALEKNITDAGRKPYKEYMLLATSILEDALEFYARTTLHENDPAILASADGQLKTALMSAMLTLEDSEHVKAVFAQAGRDVATELGLDTKPLPKLLRITEDELRMCMISAGIASEQIDRAMENARKSQLGKS